MDDCDPICTKLQSKLPEVSGTFLNIVVLPKDTGLECHFDDLCLKTLCNTQVRQKSSWSWTICNYTKPVGSTYVSLGYPKIEKLNL